MTHSLEKRPIQLLHQVGDHASSRSALARVAISTADLDKKRWTTYQWTKTVPPHLMASLMNRMAPGS